MTHATPPAANLDVLDEATVALVRLSARICAGSEGEVRDALAVAAAATPHAWVEELILQSYLFAGLPRTLNSAREWRRISGSPAPHDDEGTDFGNAEAWRARGERTCAAVYGRFYDRLRRNVRELHPALDAWMVVEGYGKVLGRPQLDLARRELCIVAACAAAGQDRQLHSHLHGALHVGATVDAVSHTLAAVGDMLDDDARDRFERLWRHVRESQQ
jgi:4-carboxymuconolactone decarboxylase